MSFSSGKNALVAALRCLELTEDSEVIIPTYVCEEVLEAVISSGCKPVLCDVSERGVLDPDSVRTKITRNTRALVAVNIFGNPCDISSLRRFEVPIIEDCCHSLGSHGPSAGHLEMNPAAEFSFFSFGPTKPMTTGSGGALATTHSLREKQMKEIETSDLSTEFNDLNAALGLSQLGHFEKSLARKIHIGKVYDLIMGRHAVKLNDPRVVIPFRYCIRAKADFKEVSAVFENYGVTVRRGVDALLHRKMGLDDAGFPRASEIYQHNISIPFHASLSRREVKRVVSAVKKIREKIV